MIGFMWNCPWRIEWRRPFEYWDRSQIGPFYALHHRRQEEEPQDTQEPGEMSSPDTGDEPE